MTLNLLEEKQVREARETGREDAYWTSVKAVMNALHFSEGGEESKEALFLFCGEPGILTLFEGMKNLSPGTSE